MLIHAHAVYFRLPSLPDIFKNKRQLNNEVHMYNTRSSQDFHRVTINSIFGSRISSNLGAKLWNLLPPNIKTENNRNTFAKLLKEYLKLQELKC